MGGDAAYRRGTGERGRVVAGRVRGDPASSLLLGERLNGVRRAAILERADALQMLGLHEDLGADPRVERARVKDRRAPRERSDAPRRVLDVGALDLHAVSNPTAAPARDIRRTGRVPRGME